MKSSLDSLNNYSESPVHVAIRLSQEKVLKILLENGANCRMPCGDLFAIHLALKSGSHRCAEILLKHDAECAHDRDKKYEAKPLHWARSSKVYCIGFCQNILLYTLLAFGPVSALYYSFTFF